MPRAARPSDIYRLPKQTRASQSPFPEPDPPPRRRFPAWVAVAGVLAVALIISGLVRGATEAAAPGNVPLVDVVSEDQAIAALRLYGAQASTIDDLQRREDIYASPGPGAAAGVARRGLEQVQAALTDARRMPGADPLAAAYWNSPEHVAVIDELNGSYVDARDISLLAATHDTLFSGSGAIQLPAAYDQLNGRFESRRHSSLNQWASALVEQMEDRNRVAEAAAAREATGQSWARQVRSLRPAATAELVAYIEGLPPVTVDGLRGHPVAGPALRLLEQHSRQVSTARP